MFRIIAAILVPSVLFVSSAAAQSLAGSGASLSRQNRAAETNDFTYLRTGEDVERFVANGLLVELPGNADYALEGVSFPYGRPEALEFVEQLAQSYRLVCAEKLVVTSLTRPIQRQPQNASDRSVHPTGIAIDLRRTNRLWCRRWLEETLLALEAEDLIEATRERHPPHYHVVVFPTPYTAYIAAGGRTGLAHAISLEDTNPYRVRSGDSLWAIADSYGTTIDRLREMNGLHSSRIYAGQLLRIPEAN